MKIELLAPAKDLTTACVAIDYGADALYMGAARFGARIAAGNCVDDIARAVEYAHRFGARVYVTLNTVLYDDELDDAQNVARQLIAAGVDALIIQDTAYLEMGLSGVEFHASTQMQNTTPEHVRFLEQAGFSRAILERGLTAEQIRSIRRETTIELEAFVHGAICVCHSGRCYMSRTMSERSGNRGDCSQPCRLTYDLVDGNDNVIAEKQHFLSLMDLNLASQIGTMLDLGVTSFKIEGRLKSEEYVKNTVAFYRQKLDSELDVRRGLQRSSVGKSECDFTPDLAKTFSRGATEYFLGGKQAGVASFDTPKSKGTKMGTVSKSGAGWFAPSMDLCAGDGITFNSDGVRINSIDGERVTINGNTVIPTGTTVYRNYDSRFYETLKRSRTVRKIDVHARWIVSLEQIELVMFGDNVNTVSCAIEGRWDEATDRNFTEQLYRRSAESSGGTMYNVVSADIVGDKLPFTSAAERNELRRRCLSALTLIDNPSELPSPLSESVFPSAALPATANVTNRLAEQFYRRCGVNSIAPQLEMGGSLHGETVMRTPYCIRREMGVCMKAGGREEAENLYLVRGTKRYRLEFDCHECEMSIVYE